MLARQEQYLLYKKLGRKEGRKLCPFIHLFIHFFLMKNYWAPTLGIILGARTSGVHGTPPNFFIELIAFSCS